LANGGGVVFPVKFFDMGAEVFNDVVVVSWVAESYQLSSYVLQRAYSLSEATDVSTLVFDDLHVIPANAYDFLRYSYKTLDYHPLRGMNYYRLKTIDYDGTVGYSPLVSVMYDPGPLESFRVYPTVTETGRVIVEGAAGEVRIADLSGRLVVHSMVGESGATFDLSAEPDGVYSLSVFDGGKARFFKIVKSGNGF
jgi:hypothetical protein